MRWLDSINSMDTNLKQTLGDSETWCVAVYVVAKSWT